MPSSRFAGSVSVGVPVYNGERFIARCLESLIAQTYPILEIIVADNASVDGTLQIVEQYAARDDRIRVIGSDVNLGAAANFNRIVECVSGEYFTWQAVDDVWDPHTLEQCVLALEGEPQAVIAYPRAVFVDDEGEELYRSASFLPDRPWPRQTRRRTLSLLRATYQDGRAAMVMVFGLWRTRSLKESALIGNVYGGDCTLIVDMGLRGRFVEVPEYIARIQMHPKSSSSGRRTFDVLYQQEFMNPFVTGWWRAHLNYRRRYIDIPAAILRSRASRFDKFLLAAAATWLAVTHFFRHERTRVTSRVRESQWWRSRRSLGGG